MPKATEDRLLLVCGILLTLAALIGIPAGAHADEPACQCEVTVSVQGTTLPAFLSKLPYLNRLFTPSHTTDEAGERASSCECVAGENLPYQVLWSPLDPAFTFVVGDAAQAAVATCRWASPHCEPTTACGETAACCAEGDSGCDTEGCAASSCPGSCCETECCQDICQEESPENRVAACGACVCCKCGEAAAHSGGHVTAMWKHVEALAAAKAAAEAQLETKDVLLSFHNEYLGALAQAMADNARLEARVEFQAEREELAKQLHELAAENARLKAEVQLAGQREEQLRESLKLALENEQLKRRLADLESQHAGREISRAARNLSSEQQAR